MSPPTPFAELIRRLRAGDPRAAEEFVVRYAPAVRRVGRVLRLRRHCPLDSEEIAQSVLASVCVRLRLGQYDLATEEHLGRLLRRIASNKAADRGRAAGQGPKKCPESDLDVFAGKADGAAVSLEIRELIDKARRLFTDEEWDLVERRKDAQDWPEIAAAHGRTPEAVRKRYERAVARVETLLQL